MNSLVIAVVMLGGYYIAYHTYGKFLARKIFKLKPDAVCPSEEFRDDHDFIPTEKHVLFGHHYTSIAGLGPIVGPAIAIIWGWVPAVIWIFFGAIFFGAVHDFGALVLSLRAKGRSIGDIAADVVNKRVRTLFLLIIFFGLWIVIAVFAMIIAKLFIMFPEAVIPVWFELPIAVVLGWLIYKKGMDALWPSIIAVLLMYVTVVIGAYAPVNIVKYVGSDAALIIWIIIVLVICSWLASSLPVQTLLQPRDFINSHQLLIAMAMLVLGVVVAQPPIVAPAINHSFSQLKDAPPLLPVIFVVIACGSISGFHSLVSSGTTSKQCDSESCAQFIGYGSMLMEGALATLVVVAVAAGIGMGLEVNNVFYTGTEAFSKHYETWKGASGLGSKLDAFVYGSANMIHAYGIPLKIAVAVMSVFVVSFASTTVDTATRIQRYVVVELATAYNFKALTGRQAGTLFAVITAAILVFYDSIEKVFKYLPYNDVITSFKIAFSTGGKGALKLWPLFGSVNQLLAGLALLIVTIYLARRKTNFVFTAIPMIFMVIVTGWAMIYNINNFYTSQNWMLFIVGLIVILLEIWMIIESIVVMKTVLKE